MWIIFVPAIKSLPLLVYRLRRWHFSNANTSYSTDSLSFRLPALHPQTVYLKPVFFFFNGEHWAMTLVKRCLNLDVWYSLDLMNSVSILWSDYNFMSNWTRIILTS